MKSTKQKAKFFESLHLPAHINHILNNNDFLVIASNLPEETLDQDYIMEIGLDITNMEYEDDDINLDEFIERYCTLADILLSNPYIMGLCYTQLYDVEQEKNGLYTYQRKPKFDMEIISRINRKKAAIEEQFAADN